MNKNLRTATLTGLPSGNSFWLKGAVVHTRATIKAYGRSSRVIVIYSHPEHLHTKPNEPKMHKVWENRPSAPTPRWPWFRAPVTYEGRNGVVWKNMERNLLPKLRTQVPTEGKEEHQTVYHKTEQPIRCACEISNKQVIEIMHLKWRRNTSTIYWKFEALIHTTRINYPREKRTGKDTNRVEISSGKNTDDLASIIQYRKWSPKWTVNFP